MKLTDDEKLAIFNRWFRIVLGLFFFVLAYFQQAWPIAILGFYFFMQGLLNRGCHGECYTLPQSKNWFKQKSKVVVLDKKSGY